MSQKFSDNEQLTISEINNAEILDISDNKKSIIIKCAQEPSLIQNKGIVFRSEQNLRNKCVKRSEKVKEWLKDHQNVTRDSVKKK